MLASRTTEAEAFIWLIDINTNFYTAGMFHYEIHYVTGNGNINTVYMDERKVEHYSSLIYYEKT